MRFHHSTRRGRNRLAHQSAAYHHYQQAALGAGAARLPLTGSGSAAGRWSQLAYCRETSIHFNSRLPVAPPETGDLQAPVELTSESSSSFDTLIGQQQTDAQLIDLTTQLQHPQPDQVHSQVMNKMNELSLAESNSNNYNSSTSMTTSTIIPNPKHKRKLPNEAKQQQQQQDLNAADTQDLIKIQTDGKLDMESARQKLVAQVEKHPFWSNKAAKRMRLTGVEVRRVYIYELTSYCERRELEWKYEPYRGGLVHATPFRRLLASTSSAPGSSPSTSGVATGTSTPAPPQQQQHQPASAPVTTTCGSAYYYSTQTPDVLAETQELEGRQFTYSNQPQQQLDQIEQQHQALGRQASAPRAMSPTSMASSGFVTGSQDQRTASSAGGSLVAANRSPVRRTSSSHSAVVAPQLAALSSINVSTNSPTLVSHNLYLQQQQQQQQQQATSVTTATTTGQTFKYESLGSIDKRRMEPSAQLVWSIEIPPQAQPAPFTGCVHSTELPNSSFVKRCHGCQGRGRLKCNSCYGVGYEVCLSCSGKGTTKSLSSGLGSSGPFSSSLASGRAGHYPSGSGRSNYADDHEDSGGAFSSSSASHSRGRNDPGGITSSSGSSSGAWVTESCHYCHGAGQKRCWVCAGKSYNHCYGCNGTGQLRCYLNVNVTWINHRDESILNNSDNIIPKERLRLSSGLILIDQIADRLRPLSSSPALEPKEGASSVATSASGEQLAGGTRASLRHRNQKQQPGGATGQQANCLDDARQLESVSRRLLERHLNTYRQERLICQRQRVTQIECHIVSYEWKQRRGHFVIYGDERKVYIAKYPFKSFCSIT